MERLTPKQEEVSDMLAGPQRHSLIVGGSRSGKTFLFCRAVLSRALREPSRHGIFRYRQNAVKASIGLDTMPKVARICFPKIPVKYHKMDSLFSCPNGSEIWLGGLDEAERVEKVLGLEFATIYQNETSQIPYSSSLVLQTRLAQNIPGMTQRAYYDLNPVGKGHYTRKLFVEKKDPTSGMPLPDPEDYAYSYMNPEDNKQNLSKEYLRALAALPERQRIRFYKGEYVDELDNALWTLEMLERLRISPAELPQLKRIVVAVDPSGCSGPEDKRSDEIGIIVVGIDFEDIGYVLEDLSGRYSPEKWGKVAVGAFMRWHADAVLGETNYGGDMVRATIHNVNENIPFRMVTATRGKVVRAEPISALYEKNRIRLAGKFEKLEEQMTSFTTGGYVGERSPDRADAMVWGFTDLFPTTGNYGFIGFLQHNAAVNAGDKDAIKKGEDLTKRMKELYDRTFKQHRQEMADRRL